MSNAAPDPKQIFLEAFDRESPEELLRYLDEACGDNVEVRTRVEALLRAHGEVGKFLGGPPPDTSTTDQPITEKPGTQIGPYKLLQQIGEGGMGVVYMAEQTEPVKRRVALKIIKPGMDTRQVIARFEAERQALAMMDHPNIAKVLDAGATDSGRPYFVMELVNGIPVTKYCDQQHLTPKERLQLFIPICQAIQHAHQKGIIHRDLKPSNVLIALYDGEPAPKVIDFGVAKATGQTLTEKTMFTQLGQIVGTLEYMSPEQAQRNQLDIDTRSDIYSLGVLLYELLTGATPFDGERLRSAAFEEMMRIIREEEPPRPSLRLSTIDTLPSVAANRKIEPKKLGMLVRGELDWIVMKALDKDRARRYETATGFANDIQRYLNDEAVVACPPSAAYRFRKFARRNKAALTTGAVVAVALLLGLVGTTWQMLRAVDAEELAQVRYEDAEAAQEREVEQRLLAEQEKTRADSEAERAREAEGKATRKSKQLQQTLYVANMENAWQACTQGLTSRATDLLELYRPNPSTTDDLRTFEWYYLSRLIQRGKGAKILESEQPVSSLSVSERGIMAVAGHKYVRLFDLDSGRELPGWRFRTKLGNSIGLTKGEKNYWSFPFADISSDVRSVAYVSPNDPSVLLTTELRTGETTPLSGHGQTVRHAVFSPDRIHLASGDHDGFARIWDAHSGDLLKSQRLHDFLIWELAYSPDGQWLVSAGADNRIVAWNVKTDELFTLEGHYTVPSTVDGVISVAFSPDGRLLASGGADRTIRIWNFAERKVSSVLTGHADEVRSVAFSPDGTLLASGGRDNSVRLWDLNTRRQRATLRGPTRIAHSVLFSPDGKQVLAGSFDGSVTTWDSSEENSDIFWCDQPILATAISPDTKIIAAIESNSRFVRLIESQRDGKTAELERIELMGIAKAVAFSPLGILATFDDEGTLALWDCSSANDKLWHTTVSDSDRSRPLLEFSRDGTLLALSVSPNGVRLFDVKSKACKMLMGHDSPLNVLAFSSDDRFLIATGADNDICRWDLATGGLTTLAGPKHLRQSISLNHANLLACGGQKGITLFDPATGSILKNIHLGASTGLCFLNENTLVVADGLPGGKSSDILVHDDEIPLHNSEILLYDIEQGVSRFVLRGHTGAILCLSTSLNGEMIVSGSFDGSIRIWRGGSCEE